MKPVDLVSIFVRFFAANLVLWAFTFTFSMVDIGRRLSAFSIEPSPLPVFLVGGAILLLLLIGAFLLWMFPFRVARFIVPKSIESEFSVSFTAEELEVLLLSLVGVWVLIEALPQLGQLAVWATRTRLANQDATPALEPLALRILQAAFGVLLVFRSVGIRRIVNYLRTKAA